MLGKLEVFKILDVKFQGHQKQLLSESAVKLDNLGDLGHHRPKEVTSLAENNSLVGGAEVYEISKDASTLTEKWKCILLCYILVIYLVRYLNSECDNYMTLTITKSANYFDLFSEPSNFGDMVGVAFTLRQGINGLSRIDDGSTILTN
ncbi:hypothetical protein RUM44_007838 [Polyplax serrata]|uniref:Uncharacterized protein n=1 Tax=Polyplax serrata TaxID=468196 RepID=A0ABR1BAN1_POLSC